MTLKEFDVVELIADFPAYGIKAGTVGTIIDLYADGEYEVEIADESGATLDCFAVKPDQIRLVQTPSVQVKAA